MNRFLAVLSFVGFGLAVIIHILTFYGVSLTEKIPLLYGLHFGVFIVFVPMVFSLSTFWMSKREGAFERWVWSYKKFIGPVPVPIRVATLLIVIYVFISIPFVFSQLEQDSVTQDSVSSRALTTEEYSLQSVYVARGFSAAWMMFYWLPAVYFSYHRK